MPEDDSTSARATSLLPSTSPEIDPVAENSPSPTATSSSERQSTSAENTECVVCGDKSSGKHYGQYSCEGCKSFFKRSIRRALSYTCRGTKQCPVDVHHRNQCQFCRLRKCVKMGMRKEAVQRGRVPVPSLPFHPFLPLIHPPFMNPLISSFLRPETRLLPPVDPSDSVGEFGAQLLFSVIDWTKHLPYFAELCLSDQIILLQHSWSQLFMLCASQSTIPPQVATGIANLRIKGEEGKAEIREDVACFHAQLELIRGLHLDVAELNCVKAAVLFNPDTMGLIDRNKVESVQEKIQASLDDYCRTHKTLMTGRFGRILLRLPSVRSFSSSVVERLFFSGLPSAVSVVVKDLLQQPSMPRWPLLPPLFQIPLPFLG